MKVFVPVDYINILAFYVVLKYENRRSLKVLDLEKFRELLLEVILDSHKKNEVTYFKEKDIWEGDVEFCLPEDISYDDFVSQYSYLFSKERDVISLNEDVDFYEISQLEKTVCDENDISNRFFSFCNDTRIFKEFGINTIYSEIERYLKIEKELEKCYQYLGDSLENSTQLRKLLFMRNIFLNNVSQVPEYVVDAFRLESSKIHSHDFTYEYAKSPLDLKFLAYYNPPEDDLGDLDSRIYDIFQYAIFGKTSLATAKVSEMLDNLYLSDESDKEAGDDISFEGASYNTFDDEEVDACYFVDTEEADMVFYLNYLSKLNDYMKKYGEDSDLIEAKNRLIYALDMPKESLYKEECFNNKLNEVLEIDVDEEDFDFIIDEVRFMANEVFLAEPDINTVKKLLFISTYYQLTGDDEIVDIVSSYSENSWFDSYSEIIFGDEKGKINEKIKKD